MQTEYNKSQEDLGLNFSSAVYLALSSMSRNLLISVFMFKIAEDKSRGFPIS